MRKKKMSGVEKEMLKNEIETLKDIDHPSVLQIFEYFEDDDKCYIVTEICHGRELFEEIIDRGTFDENDAAILMK